MSENNQSNKNIAELRREYSKQVLAESKVADNPIDQFTQWFQQALSAELLDANAMTLATADEDGSPSARIVLLKGVEKAGFTFYTNYGSRKGRELTENPCAALCFFWPQLERQVRIEGDVEKLSRSESEAYFRQRPRESQLGAWASKQSSKVASREVLEKQFEEMGKKFAGEEIPLPDFWGGFVLQPKRVEFWQGRKGRMHDRICYKKDSDGWDIFRLSP